MNYYLTFSKYCLIQIIDNLLSNFLITGDIILDLNSLFESINKTPEPNGSSGVGFVIVDVWYKLLIRYVFSFRYYFSDLSTDEIHFIIEYILAMDIRSFLSIIAVQIIWHIFYEAFFNYSATSSSFPHPLCTNEHWAENVLYGIFTCYHLYSSFPVGYVYIIICILYSVQSWLSIVRYKKRL